MTRSISSFIVVPYLPVLGPVHPDEVRDELLTALFAAGETLLPYDKTSRWGSVPTEKVISHDTNDGTLTIATETARGGKRYYIYTDSDRIQQYDEYNNGEILTFSRAARALTSNERGTVVFMDDFSKPFGQVEPAVHVFSDLEPSIQKDFALHLGNDSAIHGLEVSIQRNKELPGNFPVLVYVENGTVVGAIGPLNILENSLGVKQLLPCFFVVSPEHRKKGIGTALWNAMRKWAVDHGADYTVLQAELNAAAENFYRANGLRKLGHIYRKTLS